MTTFPALQPGSRAFIPGTYPGATFRTLSGRDSRVRHSNAVVAMQAKAEFPLLSESQLESIRSHYVGQYGGHKPFAVPDEFWSGANTPAGFTPSGYQWRYAGKPSIEEITIDTSGAAATLFNVSIELEAVPLAAVVLSGATFNITTTWLPGYKAVAANGATWDVTVSWVPGSSSTWGPGVDPYFANVSLLLKMDGANGSTTFTDSSNNGFTITPHGSAQISTAQSKFGGGAGTFSGGAYIIAPASSAFDFNAGDFTIEAWVYFNSVAADQRVAGGDFVNSQGNFNWAWYVESAGVLSYYLSSNGSSWNVADIVAFGPISAGQWHYVALVRSGNTITPYIDGIPGTTTTTTASIFANSTNGPFFGKQGSSYFNGIIDEIRITKGIARTITVPTAPFPTA